MSTDNLLYFEPQSIAQWDESMLDSARGGKQSYSPKTYAIRLLSTMFKSNEPLCEKRKTIILETLSDYPELTDEVKALFPEIFEV